jgi:hypothetical protein
MKYELEFRKNGKGHIMNGKQAEAITEVLNNLNVVRNRMYFEALGHRFQIIATRKHSDYMHISFLKVNR